MVISYLSILMLVFGGAGCIKEMPMNCFHFSKIFANPSQAGFGTRGRNRRTLGVRVTGLLVVYRIVGFVASECMVNVVL